MVNKIWSGSYKFYIPKLNQIQKQFSKENAYKIAGYLGKFKCPYPSGEIEAENKYLD